MAALWLLALGACAGDGSDAAIPGFGSCGDTSDCAEGLVCSPAWSICVADGGAATLVRARLVPPTESTSWVEEQYGALSLSFDGMLNLLMHRPVQVAGQVYQAGGLPFGDAKLRVVAAAPGEIPGKDYHADAFQSGGAGGFSINLSPGRLYDIYLDFKAEGDQALVDPLPPYHVRRSFSPDWASASPWELSWEVILPAPQDYLRISGTLVTTLASGTPVVGARVFAYSRASGDTSTIAETDEAGHFELRVQPPGEDHSLTPEYALHVQASVSNGMVPELITTTSYFFFEDQDLGRLETGAGDQLQPFALTVLLAPGAIPPRTDLTLHLQGQVGLGSLRLEYPVFPDEPLELNLPPGTYTAAVIPGTDSELAVASFSFTLGTVGIAHQLTLEDRPEVSGRLTTSEGNPVPGARLTAVFYSCLGGPVQVPERRFDTTSDADGAFSLLLDPGYYLFILSPPEGSGLPRTLLDGITVDSPQVRLLRFADPIALTGQISGAASQGTSGADNTGTDSGATPIPGIKLEFYSASGSGPASREPLATGYSDAEGRYLLVLPAL
jgi:hypothetical protein